MFKQVLVALNSSSATSQSRNRSDVHHTSASEQDVNTSNVTQVSINSSMSLTDASFLASQIPQFGGSEQECVELWIENIESVTEAHGLPPVAMLSAASSKLIKAARKWFELSSGSVNKSWMDFKNAITSYFKKRIIFNSVMDTAKERKWLHYKESFQDYALDKLAILRCLKLPDDSIIHCLIDGILDRPIKSSAAVIKMNSVGKFLEEMHHLTATCGTPWKNLLRSNQSSRNLSSKMILHLRRIPSRRSPWKPSVFIAVPRIIQGKSVLSSKRRNSYISQHLLLRFLKFLLRRSLQMIHWIPSHSSKILRV